MKPCELWRRVLLATSAEDILKLDIDCSGRAVDERLVGINMISKIADCTVG